MSCGYFRSSNDPVCVCAHAHHGFLPFGMEPKEHQPFHMTLDRRSPTQLDGSCFYFTDCICDWCLTTAVECRGEPTPCFCCKTNLYLPPHLLFRCDECHSVLCRHGSIVRKTFLLRLSTLLLPQTQDLLFSPPPLRCGR